MGQEIETAVTSFVIGGVTLQEDVKNPPVPSGMQRFEITMNKPVVTFNELREPETLPYFDGDSITQVTITRYFDIDRDFISYPIDLLLDMTLAQDLAVSPDSLTLTGTINLPEGATYQCLFGTSDIDPIDEQQQYFFGTAELPNSAEEILKIFLFHNLDDFARIIFPITDLMIGDTVSLLGTYTSETMFQAYVVIRHESPLARNGDIDGDGDVDFSDFLLFTSAFGTIEGEIEYNPAADLDGDGAVVFSDFLIFASAFGKPAG